MSGVLWNQPLSMVIEVYGINVRDTNFASLVLYSASIPGYASLPVLSPVSEKAFRGAFLGLLIVSDAIQCILCIQPLSRLCFALVYQRCDYQFLRSRS